MSSITGPEILKISILNENMYVAVANVFTVRRTEDGGETGILLILFRDRLFVYVKTRPAGTTYFSASSVFRSPL